MFHRVRKEFACGDPLERVGSTTSPRALIDSVCIDSGLDAAFGEDVLEEAQLVAASPAPHRSRRDLRQTYTITIDPVDARISTTRSPSRDREATSWAYTSPTFPPMPRRVPWWTPRPGKGAPAYISPTGSFQ